MNKHLTREEALKLHRDMWVKMRIKYGNYANPVERIDFKNKYCKKYLERIGAEDGEEIDNDCFLCEYIAQMDASDCLADCPIDWSKLCTKRDDFNCGSCVGLYNGAHIYLYAPISEILALPKRKVIE